MAARSQDKLEALAKQLGDHGGTSVEFVALDLSEPGAGTKLADKLERRGREIDVLVNNAGFGLFAPLHEADAKRIAQQVQLNVAALTELTCALLPGMRARNGGAIVNVASTAAFQPVPYMAVYGGTKAYVLSFTEALWAETRATGVRVTALCPGATDTAFFDTASEHASIGRRMAPEQVVRDALRALDRRRSTVIPGLGNRLVAASARLGRGSRWPGWPSAPCAPRTAAGARPPLNRHRRRSETMVPERHRRDRLAVARQLTASRTGSAEGLALSSWIGGA